MSGVAIMCFGGQGRTVADCLKSQKQEFIFLDDTLDRNLGSQMLEDARFLERFEIIVAIGDNAARKRLCETVIEHGGRLKTVRHAMSFVSPTAGIAAGCSIHFGAHIGPKARVGTGCIINNLVTVGHDCQIGDYVNLCDGTVLGGGVTIGDEAFIGLNSTIIPKAKIGRGAFVAAGSVVLFNVPDGARYGGNPARSIGPANAAENW